MEGKRFYHNDHLGTPQVLTDESGQIAWYGDYEPFGKVNILVERTTNNFRFPGQYFIEETGLYYNWWRWYGSEVGRYMEKDPDMSNEKRERSINISQYKNIEIYVYAINNPFLFVDKDGRDCLKVDGCLRCLGLFGNPVVQNAMDKLVGWGCDQEGEGCPDGKRTCCGYADVGSGFIYITNIVSPTCSRHCFVILHEIAHAVIGIVNDDSASYWAEKNLPDCCK